MNSNVLLLYFNSFMYFGFIGYISLLCVCVPSCSLNIPDDIFLTERSRFFFFALSDEDQYVQEKSANVGVGMLGIFRRFFL